MGHSTEYDHLTGETDAARITDHEFDPDGSDVDACCLTCAKRGWTTLSGDHAPALATVDCDRCTRTITEDLIVVDEHENVVCPDCVLATETDAAARALVVERSRISALSGFPLVEDAFAFALSLR